MPTPDFIVPFSSKHPTRKGEICELLEAFAKKSEVFLTQSEK